MEHNRLVFEDRQFDRDNSDTTLDMNIGDPWVYVWVDGRDSKPIYVGEYGASETYNLTRRLRYSIGELYSSTLGQLSNNYPLVGGDVDSRLVVYAFPLNGDAESQAVRKSIESWLHWLIVVKNRVHHPKYCGFNYNVPSPGEEEYRVAERIYDFLRRRLSWRAS